MITDLVEPATKEGICSFAILQPLELMFQLVYAVRTRAGANRNCLLMINVCQRANVKVARKLVSEGKTLRKMNDLRKLGFRQSCCSEKQRHTVCMPEISNK